MTKRLRTRYGLTVRNVLTSVVPSKRMFKRLDTALSSLGLKGDRTDLPYLYRLSPLQTLRNCSPLIDPAFVRARKANHMRDDDDVIGLVIEGEARAYPCWILDNHHLANDTIAGLPVVISLCEMCSSAVAFDARIDQRRLIFQTRYAFMGTNAFEDRQTQSLWSPYFGRAITGPLRDRTLKLLPAQQMHWAAWRARQPETQVLHGSLGSRTGHGAGHTLGSPALSPDMRATVPRWDHCLTHNTLVLGGYVRRPAARLPAGHTAGASRRRQRRARRGPYRHPGGPAGGKRRRPGVLPSADGLTLTFTPDSRVLWMSRPGPCGPTMGRP
jgi:uncharacterized protein DUF3179